MLAQRLPWCSCSAIKMASSSSVHSPFFSSGSRWLTNRSRHCFPCRPGRCAAILDHLRPYSARLLRRMLSSSAVHDPFPLITGGVDSDCHFVRHSMAVLPRKFPAISFHRGEAVVVVVIVFVVVVVACKRLKKRLAKREERRRKRWFRFERDHEKRPIVCHRWPVGEGSASDRQGAPNTENPRKPESRSARQTAVRFTRTNIPIPDHPFFFGAPI